LVMCEAAWKSGGASGGLRDGCIGIIRRVYVVQENDRDIARLLIKTCDTIAK
jgi:hypothetical protein